MAKNSENKQDFMDYVDRFENWIEANAKILMIAFLVCALAVAGIWAVSAIKTRAAKKAVMAAGLLNRKMGALEKAISNSVDKESEKFKADKNMEIEKISKNIEELVKDFPKASSTDYTVLSWAEFLAEEKKTEQAIETLKLVNASGERPLSASLPVLRAKLETKLGKLDEALVIYDKILAQNSWKIFHTEALIQKALIKHKKGEVKEAINLLTQARDQAPDSQAAEDATEYLRLFQLEQGRSTEIINDSEAKG